jgi:two-component system, cell cycle sensor histidine kinase and response regulator CckA
MRHGVRVLVAEDESIVAEDLRERLTKMGNTVVGSVATGEQAIQASEQSHPDLVLMDIRLRGRMDGVEAADQIRKRFHIPVVYLTAHSDDDTIHRATQTQPQGYLLKPFEERDLRANIELAMSKHALEEQLRQSEQRWATTLSSIGDAVIATDPQGRVTFVNAVAEKLTGWLREQAVGKPLDHIFQLVHAKTKTTCPSPLSKALLDAAPAKLDGDILLVTKDGDEIPIDDCAAPIFGPDRRLQGGVLVFRDVREQRAAADAQRQAQEQLHWLQRLEAIGRFAGGMAHEINNMLTVVLGCGELLLTQLGPNHVMRSTLETMQAAADRTASLTRQLLAFSRKQMLSPTVLNLNEVLQRLQVMFARLLGDDVELVLRLDARLEAVLVDRMQCEQVLVNLALNARDAMPQGGSLILETRNVLLDDAFVARHPQIAPGPYVLLTVKDTGCGMDAATQTHIFEPFFTTKEMGRGTGLGLATVFGIVTQSGGHILVESAPGQGSVFSIYLPTAPHGAAPAPQPATRPSPLSGGSETVLVVEDEEAVRLLVARSLRQMGYSVLEASSGAEALQLVESHGDQIHLLLTDVMMPKMLGPQVAQQALAKHANMKVVYMSGHTDQRNFPEELQRDGIHFLQKPFLISTLSWRVRKALDS